MWTKELFATGWLWAALGPHAMGSFNAKSRSLFYTKVLLHLRIFFRPAVLSISQESGGLLALGSSLSNETCWQWLKLGSQWTSMHSKSQLSQGEKATPMKHNPKLSAFKGYFSPRYESQVPWPKVFCLTPAAFAEEAPVGQQPLPSDLQGHLKGCKPTNCQLPTQITGLLRYLPYVRPM